MVFTQEMIETVRGAVNGLSALTPPDQTYPSKEALAQEANFSAILGVFGFGSMGAAITGGLGAKIVMGDTVIETPHRS